MSMFHFSKKREEQMVVECSKGACPENSTERTKIRKGVTKIEVLGSGCKKCNQLEEAVIEATRLLGMNITMEHVKDFEKIALYGVMSTPALVIDGKVVSYGRVLKTEDVIKILESIGK